jgi:ubiquitin-activating enzyme E1 C
MWFLLVVIFMFCIKFFNIGMSLVTPNITFPLCTLANKPRSPEHCIEYGIVQFKEKFGYFLDIMTKNILNFIFLGKSPDGDKVEDLNWIFEFADKRAKEFNIDGVSTLFIHFFLFNLL